MKRTVPKYVVDLFLWTGATLLAFGLRLEWGVLSYAGEIALVTAVGFPLKGLLIYVLRLHRQSWRDTGIRDLIRLVILLIVVTAGEYASVLIYPIDVTIPRSVPFIEGLAALFLLGGVRLSARVWSERRAFVAAGGNGRVVRVLLVGAGEAGTMVARDMLRHPERGRRPVGFLDDDPAKRRERFLGIDVLGMIDELPRVVLEARVHEVLIALPTVPGSVIRRVVDLARQAGVPYRRIPAIEELLSGKVSIARTREVDVEDLLRREPVRLDVQEIAAYLKGQVVLITGAGGSIGSEIVRQVASFHPARLVLVGRGENSIYEIDRELARTSADVDRAPVIADVRDRISLQHIFRKHQPQVVFHVGAHKHVPLMENNPAQAVLNNVGGTRNVADMALAWHVDRLVNVSTDKAVNPTSVMGASKRVAELVVLDASKQCRPGQAFVSVRFGNVLGSRGSVIPLFREQIQQGGPITLTHPDMKRFFMTIPEAAQLVLQAGSMAANGSVYVLDMGDPVKIVDLARDMILLSGLDLDDIEIRFIGTRPGEKLFEELLTADEGTVASHHEKIFVAPETNGVAEHMDSLLDELFTAAVSGNDAAVCDALGRMVPTNRFAYARNGAAVNHVIASV